MNKTYSAIYWLVFFPLMITGQALEYFPKLLPSSYTVYDIEQGLPQSCISEVFADHKGRLWLNQCGVQNQEIFNSQRFYQYDGNKHQEISMADPNDTVRYIYHLQGITRSGLLFGVNQEQSKCFVLNPVKPEKTSSIKKKKTNNPTGQPAKTEKPAAAKVAVSGKEAEKYIPKNIEFEQAKIIILKSSYQELNSFAQFMLDHPHLTVMIEGHTDPVGDAEMNLQRSKDRARTVASCLVDKGVDSMRIKTEGYGGSRPLMVPKEGTYYPANRRVVFIVSGY